MHRPNGIARISGRRNKTRRIHANRRIAFCRSIALARLTVQFNDGPAARDDSDNIHVS